MKNNYLFISHYLGFMLLGLSVLTVMLGMFFFLESKVIFIEWDMVSINSQSLIMTFLFDWMSMTFMGFVLLISSMVLLYSKFYLEGDLNFSRFIILVFLFVLSMVLLILSPNMVSILLGWDGLGLISYCLVIYYHNMKSANAGMLTILSNRIGDVAILLSIAWMLNFGSWNFFYLQYMYKSNELMLILFLVFISSMTKSAQLPFSAWLPAAMAAPTPVSSLVHSSTLVTAGVYLIIRFSPLLGESKILFIISISTMMMSSVGANFEMDLKKVIALSTLSQLGVMFMSISLGLVELAFFHLLSHALFKSLLFLCAGVLIHGMGDMQDIRKIGGSHTAPMTSFFMFSSSLSLCGFPFLAGFYSKDMILESMMVSSVSVMLVILVFLCCSLTALYSFRLIYYLFISNLNLKSGLLVNESMGMLMPMSVLFISSTVCGPLMMWLYFPPVLIIVPLYLKYLTLLSVLISMLIMYFLMNNKGINSTVYYKMSLHFFSVMWFMPLISSSPLIMFLKYGKNLLKNLDQGWMEFFGGQGMNYGASKFGLIPDSMNEIDLKNYILMFFFVFSLFFLML
uniref:NADH-ubiquinone oxidoreductase chain 5 n=1 Tax=Novacerus sp. FZ-2019 TaxID=2585224 RepID=A0A6H0EXH2_9HEXA|nr:NADH dehydrogenase subunit 5 [Novacerus sp. FZ-2019]